MAWAIADNNYEGKGMLAITILLGVVDLFCVSVRFYSRYLQSCRPALNDYVLLAGFAMTIGLIVIDWATYSHGYGLDISEFTLQDAVASSKLFASTIITWNASTTLIRLSMILFHRQIFTPITSFNAVSISIIVVNLTSFVGISLTSVLICKPIQYVYVRVGNGYCGNVKAFEACNVASALLQDIGIVCLPMPYLWNLHIQWSKKWGLTIIMGIGVFICCLTAFRLVVAFVYMPEDVTKQSALVMFITGLEPILGIIVACLPFFPTFLAHVRNSDLVDRLLAKRSEDVGQNASPAMGHGHVVSNWMLRGSRLFFSPPESTESDDTWDRHCRKVSFDPNKFHHESGNGSADVDTDSPAQGDRNIYTLQEFRVVQEDV